MSEEKKIIELNDEELEKVSGGITESEKSELISGLQQIQSMISNSTIPIGYKEEYNGKIDSAILSLNDGRYSDAKFYLDAMKAAYSYDKETNRIQGVFHPSFNDDLTYVCMLMNNIN